MDEKTPHVCFALDGKALPIVVAHLRERFDAVRNLNLWFLRSRAMFVQLGEHSYTAVLSRNRFREGEWILVLHPSGEGDVMRVCREIHESLAAIPGISRVRWYFRGSNNQSQGFATPDELPWL